MRNTREILHLSWPILIAQLAMLANGVADTVMAGHYRSADLAAVGIGASVYVTVWVGFMGVLQSLSPLIGRHFGAGEMTPIGVQVRQGALLALALSALGLLLLALLAGPALQRLRVPSEVAAIAGGYLRAIAWGLPASLLARVFYALTPAVGRPRPVMAINLAMVLVKVPLSYALLFGKFGLPELGGVGLAVASAIELWIMFTCCVLFLLRDPFYQRFAIFGGSWCPDRKVLKAQLGLGVPMAGAQLVDATAFTFMALLLARLGAQVSAAHQVVANMAVVLFMVPLSTGIGTQVLISQSLGRGDPARARELAWTGLKLGMVCAIVASALVLLARANLLGAYSNDAQVLPIALSLMPLLAAYHLFDALQCVAVNALRGYHQTLIPTLIYVAALWGIGLGGGWWLGFSGFSVPLLGFVSAPLGAWGMWLAGAVSLAIAGCALTVYLAVVAREGFEA
jgi:multidrug resistance protein, MATE family